MSSKFICDNSSKDKALECLKCEENSQCVIYNKDENVIYINSEKVCDEMCHDSKKHMQMRMVMNEARKCQAGGSLKLSSGQSAFPSGRPQIVHL